MSYTQFQPHPVLREYIDAYWTMKGSQSIPVQQRIYPDGCIDIIVNLGGEFLADNGILKMKNEASYLVGTMTRFADVTIEADTYLLGIRFKPLGFTTFYQFSSLHEITNRTIDFNKSLLPEINQFDHNTVARLDVFFSNKIASKNHLLPQVMETIKRKKGLISIEQVAKQHFVTDRQLERHFRRHLGISPKEYASFIRYQSAIRALQKKTSNENLLDVALETGYYDRAHLHNEIKKYSGLLPSQLQNVGFLQTSDIGSNLDLPV